MCVCFWQNIGCPFSVSFKNILWHHNHVSVVNTLYMCKTTYFIDTYLHWCECYQCHQTVKGFLPCMGNEFVPCMRFRLFNIYLYCIHVTISISQLVNLPHQSTKWSSIELSRDQSLHENQDILVVVQYIWKQIYPIIKHNVKYSCYFYLDVDKSIAVLALALLLKINSTPEEFIKICSVSTKSLTYIVDIQTWYIYYTFYCQIISAIVFIVIDHTEVNDFLVSINMEKWVRKQDKYIKRNTD